MSELTLVRLSDVAVEGEFLRERLGTLLWT